MAAAFLIAMIPIMQRNVAAAVLQEKWCPVCGETKGVVSFYSGSCTPDGLSDNCRSCCRRQVQDAARRVSAQTQLLQYQGHTLP